MYTNVTRQTWPGLQSKLFGLDQRTGFQRARLTKLHISPEGTRHVGVQEIAPHNVNGVCSMPQIYIILVHFLLLDSHLALKWQSELSFRNFFTIWCPETQKTGVFDQVHNGSLDLGFKRFIHKTYKGTITRCMVLTLEYYYLPSLKQKDMSHIERRLGWWNKNFSHWLSFILPTELWVDWG